MRIFYKIPVLVCIGLMGLSAPAVADHPEKIRFVTMMLVPYGFKGDDGKPAGYLKEIGDRIAEEAGMTIDNPLTPVRRIHQNMAKGTTDCMLAARIPTTEAYNLVEPIGFSISLVIAPRTGLSINTYDDLYGLRIAVARGTEGAFKKFAEDDNLQRYMTSGYRENMVMLERGRVDAVYGAWGSLMFNLQQLGYDPAIIGKPYIFNQTPMWLICANHLKDERKIRRLREATIRLRESGYILKVIRRYIGRTIESAYHKTD